MSKTLNADLELALTMADLADVITMQHYQSSSLTIESKPDLTPVTEADRAAEQALRAVLAEQRPLDDILGEEFGASAETSTRRWIIDPIDGTKNYVRGVPVWSTLIALTIDAIPVLGVVSAPALARRWWAATGDGAWTTALGSSAKAISVSAVANIEDASFSYSDAIGWKERGAIDVSAEPDLGAWDMAALIPIITEAGGKATAFDGGPALEGGCLVATNGILHGPVLDRLKP